MASIPALRHSPVQPQFPRNPPAHFPDTAMLSSARPGLTRAVTAAIVFSPACQHRASPAISRLRCHPVLLYAIPRLMRSGPEIAPCFCVGVDSAVCFWFGGEIYCINDPKNAGAREYAAMHNSSSLSQSCAPQHILKILVPPRAKPGMSFMSIGAYLSSNCPIGTPSLLGGPLLFILG